MNELRYLNNHQPEIAKARAEMAAWYRNLRKTRPDIARMVFVRVRAGYRKIKESIVDNLYRYGSAR